MKSKATIIKPPNVYCYNQSKLQYDQYRIHDLIYCHSHDKIVTMVFCVDINPSGGIVEAHINTRDSINTIMASMIQRDVQLPTFIRCHRAYIVNERFMDYVDPHTKQLHLNINITNKIIPISRRNFVHVKNNLIERSLQPITK